MSRQDIPLGPMDRPSDLPIGEGFNDPLQPRAVRSAPAREQQAQVHPGYAGSGHEGAHLGGGAHGGGAHGGGGDGAGDGGHPPQGSRKKKPHHLFSHLKPGQLIEGTYELIEPLGQGGMGVVWKARDLKRFNRLVALKFIKYGQDIARNQAALERFDREAMVSARLQHPNITTLYDFISLSDGARVIVLEYVMGETLTQYIRREVQLDVLTAIHIALQLSHALGHLHQANLIHRDLKPDNIMLTPLQGGGGYLHLKLIDLGIAKLINLNDQAQNTVEEECATPITQAGFVCGTPEYMAPEQLQGKQLSPRSDIYAVGVLLFEMLAGKPPFRCTNWHLFAATRAVTAIPDVRTYCPWVIPQSLVTVINTCLEYQPAKRYASTNELARALEEVLLGSFVQLLPLSSLHLSERGRSYINALNDLAQTPAAEDVRAAAYSSVFTPASASAPAAPVTPDSVTVAGAGFSATSHEPTPLGEAPLPSGRNLSDFWRGQREGYQSLSEWAQGIIAGLSAQWRASQWRASQWRGSARTTMQPLLFLGIVSILVVISSFQKSKEHRRDLGHEPPRAADVKEQEPAAPLAAAPLQMQEREASALPSPLLAPHQEASAPSDVDREAELHVQRLNEERRVVSTGLLMEFREQISALQVSERAEDKGLKGLEALQKSFSDRSSKLIAEHARELSLQLTQLNELSARLAPLFTKKGQDKKRIERVISQPHFDLFKSEPWMLKLNKCYRPGRPPCAL